ncbi:hypothetical protein ACIPZG_10495 [Pseudomonas sp. NPDC089395]|uniref:hypothetical protein n=1 Tax=Pseudomonas sp. NPDC089395 TaxID=3364460 RepID=UPI003823E267
MSSTPAVDYWHALQIRQPEWALRAYARLIKTLSKDVQERLQRKDTTSEPYVVVFGKTQVGKTTLLLDLMGVAPDRMNRISSVLRGGREAGKSATATTMEYCRSTSDRWGLSRNGKLRWLEHDEQMTQALGALRVEMESGRLKGESTPCVVHIPKSCFLGSTQVPSVRMLDLPGDNPANEEEQRHVHQMAKTYLPFADLILLVGKGDDLGFLRPGVITLPGIEDWQSMPYRFRIVTTHSYSAQSLKDILRKESDVDVTRVRQRLIQQIERFGTLSQPAQEARLYFPLEFGKSWAYAQSAEPELYARMAPIITKLRDELLTQIANSITPMGRLRSTLDTHISVTYIQRKKTEAIDSAIQVLEKKLDIAEDECKSWDKMVVGAHSSFDKLAALMKEKPAELGASAIERAAKALLAKPPSACVPKEGPEKDDCETLKTLIRKYYEGLMALRLDVSAEGCPLGYWRRVSSALVQPETERVEELFDDAFGPIRYTLDDYWFDTYLSSSNYQADLRSVREAGSEVFAELVVVWAKCWLQALNRIDEQVRKELVSARVTLAVYEEEASAARARHAQIQQMIAGHVAERQRIVLNSKEDLERCERFKNLLEQEYAASLDQQYTAALQETDNSEALLQLLSCVALNHQYHEFLALNDQQAS